MRINFYFLTIIIFLLFMINSCRFKPIIFAKNYNEKEENISFEQGEVNLINENLNFRYLITGNTSRGPNKDDIIFYFHGISCNEYQWLNKDGFGKQYHDIIIENPELSGIPVVAISFGMAILLIDDVPFPFDADLETIFLNKIIPYFREKLNRNGKIYLIGHSMGGYSALSLGLRYPEKFPIVVALSPFVSNLSPFDEKFIMSKTNQEKKDPFKKIYRKLLLLIFDDEEKWQSYNSFDLIEKDEKEKPVIFISKSKKEIHDFDFTIDLFVAKLKEQDVNFSYFFTDGDHQKVDASDLFYDLLKTIYEKNNLQIDNIAANAEDYKFTESLYYKE